MTERTGPTRYAIEIGGHASNRVLRPAVDEFTVELTGAGTTRLVGEIRDSSHLNGLLAHLTSLNVEVIGLCRLHDAAGVTSTAFPTHPSNPSKDQP